MNYIKRVVLLALVYPIVVFAEESVDLDSTDWAPKAPVSQIEKSPFKLMGRVDLTYEILPYQNLSQIRKNDTFKNNHFLFFLKSNVSNKVVFFGEIISKSFFEILYKPTEQLTAHIGKVLVPFGDTSRFHHFYGGVQGLSGKGVLLPNIWAENGVILTLELDQWSVDTYLVNGFGEPQPNKDVEINTSSEPNTQAMGLRVSGFPIEKVKTILSSYFTHWQMGKPLLLLGADLEMGYHLIDLPVLKNIKILMGLAEAKIFQGLLGDYKKYGDYIEIATNSFSFVEPRIRYGTVINNSLQKSQKDSHSFDLSFVVPVDVMKLMLEYQWNFESIDEKQNDLFRIMLSLDF